MRLVLEKEVKNLGAPGDIVDVSHGYGRNFLIPKGLAKEATSDEVNKSLSAKQKARRAKAKKEKENQKLRNILEGQTILICAKANEEGNLFGGIGPQEIAEAILKRKKIKIDEKKLDFSHNLKTLGKHEINLSLGNNDFVKIFVEIQKDELDK